MTKEVGEKQSYLEGYSDGLEIVAEKLKRLSYGANTQDEILETLNGVIHAVYQGRAEIVGMKEELEQQEFHNGIKLLIIKEGI